MSYYIGLGFRELKVDDFSKRLKKAVNQRFIVEGHGPIAILGDAKVGRILFAHGAGAGHTSVFMRQFVATMVEHGLQVCAIDFPYMQQINEQGKRRPPPPVKSLLVHFNAWYRLLEPLSSAPLWVGGKSMGGRIASLFASEISCPGVVVSGYPFHPPAKPENLRLSHFPNIACPMLILQGERDPFGTQEEVCGYTLPGNIKLAWLADGDHDFKPRRASGLKQTVLIDEAATLAASFVRAH